MNKTMIIGHLTADPEMKMTNSGISVCTFRVAVNRKYKDADGNQQTDFLPVTCRRQLADLCGRYLAKGKKVAVVGSLQSNSYEDKDGNRRTGYQIVADEVEFLTPRGNEGSRESAAQDEHGGFDEDSSLPF